jgi:hypothetical protein
MAGYRTAASSSRARSSPRPTGRATSKRSRMRRPSASGGRRTSLAHLRRRIQPSPRSAVLPFRPENSSVKPHYSSASPVLHTSSRNRDPAARRNDSKMVTANHPTRANYPSACGRPGRDQRQPQTSSRLNRDAMTTAWMASETWSGDATAAPPRSWHGGRRLDRLLTWCAGRYLPASVVNADEHGVVRRFGPSRRASVQRHYRLPSRWTGSTCSRHQRDGRPGFALPETIRP